tara:strand:+ start:471 stop:1025 length:555 start_codon:yes stop_codon:yes gene_type:complete
MALNIENFVQTPYVLIWIIIIIYLNHIASKFAYKRSLLIEDKPLPDLLHDLFPIINRFTPDYLILLCFFIYFLLRIEFNSSEVIKLYCSLSLRPFFVCMTTFPTSQHIKEEKKSLYAKLFLSSHDLMFSGHTCIFFFFGNVINGILGNTIKYLFPFTLIAGRQHYTIDVVVAMLVYGYINLIIT